MLKPSASFERSETAPAFVRQPERAGVERFENTPSQPLRTPRKSIPGMDRIETTPDPVRMPRKSNPGLGIVEATPDPVRIRAANVTDDDICAMAATVGYLPGGGL